MWNIDKLTFIFGISRIFKSYIKNKTSNSIIAIESYISKILKKNKI